MRKPLMMLGFYCSLSFAAPLTALYDVNLAQPGQNRLNDLKQALTIAVNRLTPGNTTLEPPISTDLTPTRLAKLIKHQTIDDAHHLHVTFLPEAIHAFMEEAGQVPWLDARPELILWVYQVRQFRLLTREDSPGLYKAFERAAKSKGLQLRYPPTDLIQNMNQNIQQRVANEPYLPYLTKVFPPSNTQAVLRIQLNNDDKALWETWGLSYQGDFQNADEEERHDHSDTIGYKSIHEISRYLFEHAQKQKHAIQSVYVNIQNVRTPLAYKQVQHYISELPGVLRASVNSVTEDAILYTLDIIISPDLLNHRLRKKYTALPEHPKEGIKHYRLNA